MDLIKGALGPEGKYELKIEDGKLIVMAGYMGADMGADVAIKYDAVKFVHALMDKVEELIPGDQKAIVASAKLVVAGALKWSRSGLLLS